MPYLNTQALQNFYKTSPMREGVLAWYPFAGGSSVLEQSGGALTQLLRSKCRDVTTFSGEYAGKDTFDYVVAVDPGEITAVLLEKYHGCLKPHGRLLLAFENPYGLQYFAGKRNPRTGTPFRFWSGESKAEVSNRLKLAGFEGQKWYYPFTNHYFSREVYSENYLPNEFLNHRGHVFIEDDYPKAFDERGVWKELIRGGAFEFMCNAYLAEARTCGGDAPCDVDFAAVTAYRERGKAFVTTVHNNGAARKTALFEEGTERLKAIADNHNDLARLGTNILPVTFMDGELTMKRLDLPTLWDYWADKLSRGTLAENELFSHFDRIRNAIYASAKDGRCYWELVPANCFYDEKKDEMTFFDQEYYWENTDPDMALVRAIYAMEYSDAFRGSPQTEDWAETLKNRYGLTEKWDALAETADVRTREYVFNGAYTQDLNRAAERAGERMAERTEERVAERAEERARYNKMCIAAVGLKAMNVTRPAIYGYGIRGKMLRFVLESMDMDIACIIDRRTPVVRGIPLYGNVRDIPGENMPDIVVVTVTGADAVALELRAALSCPAVTIEEIVNG
ncbi:MAG: hypothetical protein LBT26_08410 [Clostridiales Family XIII bacterium]|nr:hypothetical protein [Clostridiales Family XIII bacterium]